MTFHQYRRRMNNLPGYQSAIYSESFSDIGTPLRLNRSKGFIIKRQINYSAFYDAMGCYPLFLCSNWENLKDDIDNLEGKLISLALVTDPFGNYDENLLRNCFHDVVFPYKQHFVIDLEKSVESYLSKNHQRNIQKAQEMIDVEICYHPLDFLDDWLTLYAALIERHKITNFTKFSREAFTRQLSVPGITLLRGVHQDQTVSMLIWYTLENRSYYHLGASSPLGYELKASFALFWSAIEHFTGKVKWLNLGAGAGFQRETNNGLTRFKQGWSSETKTAYFCGRILDRENYIKLIERYHKSDTSYFPAYREGEFN